MVYSSVNGAGLLIKTNSYSSQWHAPDYCYAVFTNLYCYSRSYDIYWTL